MRSRRRRSSEEGRILQRILAVFGADRIAATVMVIIVLIIVIKMTI
jgi:hypothetical protein